MLQVIFRYTNEDDLLPIINPILSRILLSLKSKDFRVVHQASSLLFMSRSLLNCTSKIPLKCPLLNVIDTLHFLSTSFWNEYIYYLICIFIRQARTTATYAYKLILLQVKIATLDESQKTEILKFEEEKNKLFGWINDMS